MDAYLSFRSRDFRLLLAGHFLSMLGLQMLSVAVSWDLYEATKSAIVLGNVGLVQVTPFVVFALLAGHFADRHDRQRIMVFTQIPLIITSALLLLENRSVALVYACLFVNATARAFQGPARLSLLPLSVPGEVLRNAITWNASAQEIATISGPAVAGFLLALAGSKTVYLVQLICTVLTTVCYAMLRIRAESPAPAAPAPPRGALMEGVRFVRKDNLILPAMALDLFAVLFGGATALLPIFAVDVLHTDARGLGWLRAAPSVGAIAMAFFLSHSPKPKRAGRLLLWAVAGFGVATIVFGVSRSFWLSALMLGFTGAFDNVSVVLRESLVQTRTPDYLKGRVIAVRNIFISCSNQLGAVESGWTAAWFGAITSVVLGGCATIGIVGAFAARANALRNWKQ